MKIALMKLPSLAVGAGLILLLAGIESPASGLTLKQIGARNPTCLACHEDILDVKSLRRDVITLHKRHLESSKATYQHKNRLCVTCHAGVLQAATEDERREGYVNNGSFLHPVYFQPESKRMIRRALRPDGKPGLYLEGTDPRNPYIFKPNLQRLVCVDCHGPGSRIKTLYGTAKK